MQVIPWIVVALGSFSFGFLAAAWICASGKDAPHPPQTDTMLDWMP